GAGVDGAAVPRRDEGGLRALVLDGVVDGVEDGVVLDAADDDAAALRVRRPGGAQAPDDREVVGLGAAGGEDDLAGPRPERRSELLARLLHGAAGSAAPPVGARGVAGERKLLDHRLPGRRGHRRGRRVVEVRAHHPESTSGRRGIFLPRRARPPLARRIVWWERILLTAG